MINRVGVCSWSLKPSNSNDLLTKLSTCGVNKAQIGLNPLTTNQDDFDRLRAAQAAESVTLCSGMMETIGEDYSTLESIQQTGGVRPDDHWDTNQALARQCAACAKNLELKLVTFHAGFIPEGDPELLQTMTDRVCMIADIFNQADIILGLETGQEHADSLLEFLSTITSRCGVGVNFDPANMILYAMGEPIQAMNALKEDIVQVHMKDAIATETPGTWGTEVVAGTGQVDWRRFFACLRMLHDPIDILIEREAGDHRIDDIRAAHTLAKLQIEQVGA